MEKKILYMSTKPTKKYGVRYAHGTKADPEEPNLDRILNTVRHDAMRGEIYDYEVRVAPGTYYFGAPVTITPSVGSRVTIKAAGGEVVFHGGRQITGFREDTFQGMKVLSAEIPAVKNGEWNFTELYVNGAWRRRPVLPAGGKKFTIKNVDGHPFDDFGDTNVSFFTAEDGSFDGISNVEDTEVEILHFWLSERMPVTGYDEKTGRVSVSRIPRRPLINDKEPGYAKYRILNAPEGFSHPGEWYLDRHAGKLYYAPLPDETAENITVTAPLLRNLIVIEGNEREKVCGVTFDGITFACTKSDQCDDGAAVKYATYGQAAANRDGAVRMTYAEDIALENCRICGAGNYGVDIGAGCHRITVSRCEIEDCGAGGIKATGADAYHPETDAVGHLRIEDNFIHNCTRIDYGAIGVYVGNGYSVRIAHNEICHLKYSGVSVGWVWGMTPSRSCNNIIEYNHIHHCGDGDMSDMGGIYLLGPQGGTEVRGNYIHDIHRANYGGWGIYLDEGSTNVLVEKNVVYDCDTSAFMIHYGSENVIRFNIFGHGDANVCFGAAAESVFATMMKNVFFVEDNPVYSGSYNYDLVAPRQVSDCNFFYRTEDTPLYNMREPDPGVFVKSSFDSWKAAGMDTLSRNYRTDAPILKTPREVRRFGFPDVNAAYAGIRPLKK